MKKFKIEMTVVADDHITIDDVRHKFKFYGTNSTTLFNNDCGIYVTELK